MATPGRTALVIDVDRRTRDAMSLLLTAWGWHVEASPSGRHASEVARTTPRPPVVIVADHELGDEGSGLEAVEDVRRACGTHVPAILILDEAGPILASNICRGLRVLRKPFGPEVLRSAVRELLEVAGHDDPVARSAPRPRV